MKLANIIEKEYEKIDSKTQSTVRVQTTGVTSLLNLFETYLKTRWSGSLFWMEKDFSILEKEFENLSYNKKDITDLSILLETYSEREGNERRGVFLSASIYAHHKRIKANQEKTEETETKEIISLNNLTQKMKKGSDEKEEEQFYLLIFSGYIKPLMYVGIKNEGSIIHIEGDVGYGVGMNMENGLIHVRGNCGIYAGMNMLNGKIIIDGNADEFLGTKMKGGEIIVHGNAGKGIGMDLENGRITIDGNYESVMRNARKYVYNKRRSIAEIEEERQNKIKE